MKRIFTIVLFVILITGCGWYGDPLKGVRRIANSAVRKLGTEDDIQKKLEASEYYKVAINTLVEAYKAHGGINKDIGRQLMSNQDFVQAIKHFEIALEDRITDSDIYYWLGICYGNVYKINRDSLDLVKAEANYHKAINLAPTNKDILYGYAHMLYYLKGDNTESIEVLRALVTLMSSVPYPEAYFLLGRIYYEESRYSDALNIYLELLKYNNMLNSVQKEKLEGFIVQTRTQLGS